MTARTAHRDLKNMYDLVERVSKNWLPRPPEWNDKDLGLVCSLLDLKVDQVWASYQDIDDCIWSF